VAEDYTSCGGSICREMKAPVLGLCAWTGLFWSV
jgi:hypothetical protein